MIQARKAFNIGDFIFFLAVSSDLTHSLPYYLFFQELGGCRKIILLMHDKSKYYCIISSKVLSSIEGKTCAYEVRLPIPAYSTKFPIF